jgi:hypothetical protein
MVPAQRAPPPECSEQGGNEGCVERSHIIDVEQSSHSSTHAIALCQCMNIPAGYCTGYLGGIGVPVDPNHGFQRLGRSLFSMAVGTP